MAFLTVAVARPETGHLTTRLFVYPSVVAVDGFLASCHPDPDTLDGLRGDALVAALLADGLLVRIESHTFPGLDRDTLRGQTHLLDAIVSQVPQGGVADVRITAAQAESLEGVYNVLTVL